MNRMALRNGQKSVETTLRVASKETIKSMDRLAIILGEKIVERTVRFKKMND